MNGPYRPVPFDPEAPMVYQPHAGNGSFGRIQPGPEAYWKNEGDYLPELVNKFDQLPIKIQTIAKQVLADSLQQWADKVTFHSAQVYSPERFFKDEMLAQSNYRLIPNYRLWFIFSFPEMRVQEYCFEMSFDKLGQVLKIDFPRFFLHLEQTLHHYELAQRLALNYVKAQRYKPGLFDVEFQYSEDSGRLNWKFYYLQNEVDTPERNQKWIRIIIVDSLMPLVIYDQELRASWGKTPVRVEGGTVVSETIRHGKKVQVVRFTNTVKDGIDPGEG
ncbi:hypothetical protein [Niabella hirudinis]|uniref:hypothetical protein n=1 Tax=Niabella hirudinis TaxID=1285929 RepID=UPI003EBBEE44